MSARASRAPADTTIDGRGFMVMPGLVNVHSHPGCEPANKGLTDEVGSPKLYNTSLYEYLSLFRADAEGIPHANRMAWSRAADVRRHDARRPVDPAATAGSTEAAKSGMRLRAGADVAQGRWFTKNGYHRRVRPGRGGRRAGRGCGAGDRRCRRQSIRAAGSAASSARRRSTPARKGCSATLSPRRPSATCRSRPTPPVDRRVPGDGAPPRHDAGGMARQASACSGRRASSATASSSITIRRSAGRTRNDLDRLRGFRRLRRPLPDRVRAPRHDAARPRQLPEGRRQRRHRHRHLPAQHDRGDAPRRRLRRASPPRRRST